MSKVSFGFGDMVKAFLKRNGLTFRGAALQTGVSAAYWKDMSDGRVPSEDVIERISSAFHDLDENELRISAGYAPRTDKLNAVQAVEFALRGQKSIPDEGKRQILDFVSEIEGRCEKKGRK
jgi:hypothetical protein